MSGPKRAQMPQSTRFEVLRRDDFKCRYCGKASAVGVTLHIDHVHPVCAGGLDHIDNLVTACSDCNAGKSGKTGVKPPPGAVNGARSAPTPPAPVEDSLVGFFGYRLDEKGHHKNQFHIKRKVADRKYAIQIFSYMDGRPTDIQIADEEELFGPSVKLYASEREWVFATCVDSFNMDIEDGERRREIASIRERWELACAERGWQP